MVKNLEAREVVEMGLPLMASAAYCSFTLSPAITAAYLEILVTNSHCDHISTPLLAAVKVGLALAGAIPSAAMFHSDPGNMKPLMAEALQGAVQQLAGEKFTAFAQAFSSLLLDIPAGSPEFPIIF